MLLTANQLNASDSIESPYRSDRATARRDVENWIMTYDQRRLHFSLCYRTPIAVRIAWQERMSITAQSKGR